MSILMQCVCSQSNKTYVVRDYSECADKPVDFVTVVNAALSLLTQAKVFVRLNPEL